MFLPDARVLATVTGMSSVKKISSNSDSFFSFKIIQFDTDECEKKFVKKKENKNHSLRPKQLIVVYKYFPMYMRVLLKKES